MNVLREIDLSLLQLHPAQPPGRLRDTTDLQHSMAKHGQKTPITVVPASGPGYAGQGYVTLSGARRLTAARALKWMSLIAVIDEEVKPDSLEALDILACSNEQKEMESLEWIGILREYEQRGVPFDKAAERLGLPTWKAQTLAALAVADPEIQNAVENFERNRDGISLSAYKEMAVLTREQQLEILRGGKTSAAQVKRQRKAIVKNQAQERVIEDDGAIDAALVAVKDLAVSAAHLLAFLGTTTDGGRQEVLEAMQYTCMESLLELVRLGGCTVMLEGGNTV